MSDKRALFRDVRNRSGWALAIIIALLMLILLGFACYTHAADLEDCMRDVRRLLHVDAPAVAWDADLRYPAVYTWSTMILRPDADCAVVFHEIVHHRQFRDSGGPPTTRDEWIQREWQARRLEIMYRGGR